MMIDSVALRDVLQRRLDQARMMSDDISATATEFEFARGNVAAYRAALLDLAEAEKAVREENERKLADINAILCAIAKDTSIGSKAVRLDRVVSLLEGAA